MRRPSISRIIIVVIAFVPGFFAHMAWVKHQQIVDIWNNLFLYYQD